MRFRKGFAKCLQNFTKKLGIVTKSGEITKNNIYAKIKAIVKMLKIKFVKANFSKFLQLADINSIIFHSQRIR